MIQTTRLLLRAWRETDLPPFVALNSDPEVMAHFPSTLDESETLEIVKRIRIHFERHDFGLYALERREDERFLGFVGLNWVPFESHFTPAVEIGWRLAQHAWGAGYASEAASAVLRYAFEVLNMPEVVSFTVPANTRSTAVMQRIGLGHDPADDFKHPLLASDDVLRQHVLYRVTRETWRALNRHESIG